MPFMKLISRFIPRLEHIFFAAVFWGIAANGHRLLNFDGDLPRHLLMGKLILQDRSVPTVDIFSFRTTGFRAIPHEWLSQIIFSGMYEWLGLNGVVLLTALIIMLVWMAVFHNAKTHSNSLFLSLIVTVLAAGASQIHVLPRPHIFTYLLTAAWIMLLEHATKRDAVKWWLFPLVMLLWVNMHGMFVLGIILWGIYLSGDFLDHPSWAWFSERRIRSLMLGGVLSLIATTLSPSGIHIWETIISLGSNSYITSKITEYQSANFQLPETWPFLILLSLTTMGLARASKVGWTYILLTIGFTFLALYTSRMIPLFAIVVSPVAAGAISKWLRDEHSKSRFALFEERITKTNSSANGWIWIVLVILGTTILLQKGTVISPDGSSNVFDRNFFPVHAVDWLETHPQSGHMYNEFDWGGYILLKTWPEYQIFMDGHTHIYGETLTREYEQVSTLRTGWEEVLEKYQVEWAIVRSDSAIAVALKSFAWEAVYEDNTAVILQKGK